MYHYGDKQFHKDQQTVEEGVTEFLKNSVAKVDNISSILQPGGFAAYTKKARVFKQMFKNLRSWGAQNKFPETDEATISKVMMKLMGGDPNTMKLKDPALDAELKIIAGAVVDAFMPQEALSEGSKADGRALVSTFIAELFRVGFLQDNVLKTAYANLNMYLADPKVSKAIAQRVKGSGILGSLKKAVSTFKSSMAGQDQTEGVQ